MSENEGRIMGSYRQGDIYIKKLEEDLDITKLELIPRVEGDIVIAHGSVTGHKHRISSEKAYFYKEKDNEQQYLVCSESVNLYHDEHGTVPLPKGNYKIVRQRSLHLNEARTIED